MRVARRSKRGAQALAAAALVTALAPPSPAGAQIIGQTNTQAFPCPGNVPYVQASADKSVNYQVPAGPSGATITAWTTYAGPYGGQMKVKMWRPNPDEDDEFPVVGESGYEQLTPSMLNSFSVSPPIYVEDGDILGLNTGTVGVPPNCAFKASSSSDVLRSLMSGGDPPPGTPQVLPNSQSKLRLNISATVYGDGLGDRRAPLLDASFPSVQGVGSALRNGIAGTVSSNERAQLTARAHVAPSLARKLGLASRSAVRVARGRRVLLSAGRKELRLRFTRAARRQLRGARRIRLTLDVAATDRRGNRASVRRRVVLKRR